MLKKITALLLLAGTVSLFADPLFMAFPQRRKSAYDPVNITCLDTAACSVTKAPDLLKITVKKKGATAGSLILGICGRVKIQRAKRYSLSFQIKANRKTELVAVCQEGKGSHATVGPRSVYPFTAGTEWKTVTYTFPAELEGDMYLRLPGIPLGHVEEGTEIWIRYVVFFNEDRTFDTVR